MTDKYILDEGRNAVPFTGPVEEWAKAVYSADRHVSDTMLGDVRVSTVFLGLDHNRSGGEPLLFETMVFKHGDSVDQGRCSTWAQAKAMHDEFVRRYGGTH